MVELDESMGESESTVRTISVKDGEVKSQSYEDRDEAKLAYITAIETMNMVMLKVS